jgi:tetratricopeptide (TPR) repeat protein
VITPRLVVLGVVLTFVTSGCARGISEYIVSTRNHQGDVAFDHKNPNEAALAYKLALRIDPKDEHARAGLAAVQLQIAAQLFVASKFDDALAALVLAAKYDPESVRLAELRSEIEQARVKREIVLSNYPTYRETGLVLRRTYAQLHLQSNAIVATLQRFDYSFDGNELTKAIRASNQLASDVSRLTARLTNYRQLVEAGSPERSAGAPLAPAASLLPLP